MNMNQIGKKKVILTIDTEGPVGIDPVLYQIWGKVGDDEYYGINKIVEICNKFKVKGLFFVDIPEIWDLGYDKIKEVILFLKEGGHDIGVHIHPHHIPGEDRHFLFDYTKEEQKKIIKDCTDKYIEICGEAPKSFRAGKYGANRDTLDIIEELGYKYDFSEFYGNKWCGINPEIAYVLPQKYKSLVEIPVTIFKSCDVFGYKRYDKMEVTNEPSEMKHILDQYSKTPNNEVIVLFMHSFSLINFRYTPNNPTKNTESLKRFEFLLRYISNHNDYEYISENDLSEIKIPQSDTIDNITETKGLWRQLYYTFKRAYAIRGYNKKAQFLMAILLFVLFMIVLSIILLLMKL